MDDGEVRSGAVGGHIGRLYGGPNGGGLKAWNSACRRAGLEGWVFHDLRRTAVRCLERAGVPRSVATKLTGHKTESVYRRYAIVDSAALAEGVERLAASRKIIPIDRAG